MDINGVWEYVSRDNNIAGANNLRELNLFSRPYWSLFKILSAGQRFSFFTLGFKSLFISDKAKKTRLFNRFVHELESQAYMIENKEPFNALAHLALALQLSNNLEDKMRIYVALFQARENAKAKRLLTREEQESFTELSKDFKSKIDTVLTKFLFLEENSKILDAQADRNFLGVFVKVLDEVRQCSKSFFTFFRGQHAATANNPVGWDRERQYLLNPNQYTLGQESLVVNHDAPPTEQASSSSTKRLGAHAVNFNLFSRIKVGRWSMPSFSKRSSIVHPKTDKADTQQQLIAAVLPRVDALALLLQEVSSVGYQFDLGALDIALQTTFKPKHSFMPAKKPIYQVDDARDENSLADFLLRQAEAYEVQANIGSLNNPSHKRLSKQAKALQCYQLAFFLASDPEQRLQAYVAAERIWTHARKFWHKTNLPITRAHLPGLEIILTRTEQDSANLLATDVEFIQALHVSSQQQETLLHDKLMARVTRIQQQQQQLRRINQLGIEFQRMQVCSVNLTKKQALKQRLTELDKYIFDFSGLVFYEPDTQPITTNAALLAAEAALCAYLLAGMHAQADVKLQYLIQAENAFRYYQKTETSAEVLSLLKRLRSELLLAPLTRFSELNLADGVAPKADPDFDLMRACWNAYGKKDIARNPKYPNERAPLIPDYFFSKGNVDEFRTAFAKYLDFRKQEKRALANAKIVSTETENTTTRTQAPVTGAHNAKNVGGLHLVSALQSFGIHKIAQALPVGSSEERPHSMPAPTLRPLMRRQSC